MKLLTPLRWTLILVASCIAGCSDPPQPASEVAKDFPPQIASILSKNCLGGECHSTRDSRSNWLSLSSWDEMVKGSFATNAVIPFRSQKSNLFTHINSQTDLGPRVAYAEMMPKNRDPLSREDQIAIKSWIDSGAMSATGRIAYTEVTRPLYVVGTGEDLLTVIDRDTKRTVRLAPLSEEGLGGRICDAMLEGNTLYTVAAKDGAISSIDLNGYKSRGKLSVTGAETIALAGAKKAYVGGTAISSIAVISTDDLVERGRIECDQLIGIRRFLSIDDRRMVVLGAKSDNLAVIDVERDTLIRVIEVADDVPINPGQQYQPKYEPMGVAASQDGTMLYVTLMRTAEVIVVSTSDWKIVRRIAVGANPLRPALSPDGNEVWIPCNLDEERSISIIKTANNAVSYLPKFAKTPKQILMPQGDFAYVICEQPLYKPHHSSVGFPQPGAVMVIDWKKRQIVTQIEATSEAVAGVAKE